MKYLIICVLWAAYCALHSFLISIRVTSAAASYLKNYYAFYRLFYVAVSLVLLIPLINYTSRFDDEIIITYTFPLSVIRYILMYGSLLIFFWAFFFSYDPLSFFGIRQIMNFGKVTEVNPEEAIRKNGLLGVIRHPMYFALIVYLWSQVFSLADLLVNLVLTIYVIIGTRLEENKLVLEFGETYKRYMQEVPMLIPFTKPKVILNSATPHGIGIKK
ncbi:MAG: methyltransferase family protein [Ignavibacteriales bacterium]